MVDQTLPIKFAESVEFTIPEFDVRPSISLSFSRIRESEKRLVEARVVTVTSYKDLEFTFNEGYREAKANLSVVMYEILQAKKIKRRLKSEYILDKYPDFLKEKGLKDNACNREAFLEKQADYVATQDRLDMLVALENLIEGKVMVFTNVCRFMKKEMDIVKNTGMNSNKF